MNGQGRRVLLSQVGDVLVDFPRFLTSPIYRRWHLHWGATPDEVLARLPGDDRFPDAQFRATRAITIAAPPEQVWPWLVQMGCLRAGWYSNDLLDNLGRPSATTIEPATAARESSIASTPSTTGDIPSALRWAWC